MWVVEAVAAALRDAGFTEVFTCRPAAWAHPEPIVVSWGGFARESRQGGEERGVATVEVRCVREGAVAAFDAARAAERALRRADRDDMAKDGFGRVAGIDTRPGLIEGTDGGGRAVCRMKCLLTIARDV